MNAHVITWNPSRSGFEELTTLIANLCEGKPARTTWSFGRLKQKAPRFGATVFLIRQGQDRPGLVGVGRVVSTMFQRPHWEHAEAAAGKQQTRAVISFLDLIDAAHNPPLSREDSVLPEESFWGAPGSGLPIHNQLTAETLLSNWEEWRALQLGYPVVLDLDEEPLRERFDEPFSVGLKASGLVDWYIPVTSGVNTYMIDHQTVAWRPSPRMNDDLVSALRSGQSDRISLILRSSAHAPYSDCGQAELIEQREDGTWFIQCDVQNSQWSGQGEGDRTWRGGYVPRRNEGVRKECIEIHGPTCFACGLSFIERYGTDRELTHVHHRFPLSRGERETDPAADLVPLCPNCHAVVHDYEPLLTPEELKLRLIHTPSKTHRPLGS